ncbi:MAG: SDR family oxidoreductase [Candidatus Rifleibacteriota bacterium]
MKQTPATVLITGVTGFAGRYLAGYLLDQGWHVIGASRRRPSNERIEYFPISNLDAYTDWEPALSKSDFVVHLAGRVHQMRDKPENTHLYFENNVDAAINLANQAVEAGITKFVFASSVKAMGEGGDSLIYNENTVCRPEDAYGRSKLKAEIELEKISRQKGLPVVILRLPLMYGPKVKGNMATLVRLVKKLPVLPLGGLKNRRSFLGLRNFSSAVRTVLESERVNTGTYMLSDGEAISTSELIDRMIDVFAAGCRNIALPRVFWKIIEKIPFAAPRVRRLSGSLAVDSSAFEREFNWRPPATMQEQFREMLL